MARIRTAPIADRSGTASHSKGTLKDATLHLSKLHGRIYDGELTGDFKAHASAASPSVDVTLKGANLDYGVFLKAFDITERVRGKLGIELELKDQGTSLRALAAGLDGRIDVNARDGQIDREMLGLLTFGAGSILEPLLGKDDTGNLDCIVTSFAFEDGLGETLVNYYETSFFAMPGDGEIDLKRETLNFVFNPQAMDLKPVSLIAGVLGGPFAAVSVVPPLRDPPLEAPSRGWSASASRRAVSPAASGAH